LYISILRPTPYQPAAICKAKLYTNFKQLCQIYKRPELLQAGTYTEAKKQATDFQAAKNLMLKKFRKNGFGQWVQKPMEEGMFS
jgi:hypothetical protein